MAVAAGVIGTAILFVMSRGPRSLVTRVTAEDGFIETLSAVFYLMGCVICASRLWTSRGQPKALLVLWMFLCFLFFAEEISWFQRLFDYPTPELVRSFNAQGELNLHNLTFWSGTSPYRALETKEYDLRLLTSSATIFKVGFFTYFLALPLILRAGWGRRLTDWQAFPTVRASFLLSLCSTMLVSFALALCSREPTTKSIVETREMLYAVFIALYVWTYLTATGNAPRLREGRATR